MRVVILSRLGVGWQVQASYGNVQWPFHPVQKDIADLDRLVAAEVPLVPNGSLCRRPTCGRELQHGASFCSKCGASVVVSTQPVPLYEVTVGVTCTR